MRLEERHGYKAAFENIGTSQEQIDKIEKKFGASLRKFEKMWVKNAKRGHLGPWFGYQGCDWWHCDEHGLYDPGRKIKTEFIISLSKVMGLNQNGLELSVLLGKKWYGKRYKYNKHLDIDGKDLIIYEENGVYTPRRLRSSYVLAVLYEWTVKS